MPDQCDATYPVRMSLSNHKRLKHGNAKQFNCEKCVNTSSNKTHLEQHVQSVHEKEKVICKTCGKNFSDKSNLNKHVRQFHPETKEGTKRKASDTLETPSKRMKLVEPENNDGGDADEKGNGEGNVNDDFDDDNDGVYDDSGDYYHYCFQVHLT